MDPMWFRKLVSRLHLWLGLPLSLYAVLIGLTGSVIVLKDDLNDWLHPELHPGGSIPITADPDAVIASIRASYPGWRPLSISWPHDQTPYWMIFMLNGPKSLEVYVNPQTGAIIGTHDPRSGWLGWTETLHTNLRWGRDGRLANGYAALGLILLALTGVVLVSPRLRLLRPPSPLPRNTYLHYSLGVVTCLWILAMGFTGAYYTWSRNYAEVVSRFLARTPDTALAPAAGKPALPIAQLVATAQSHYPGQVIHRFPIPDAKFPLRVTFRESTFAAFHRVSSVTLDPRTAAVLRVQPMAERPAGDSFLGWLSGFHFGVFGGALVQWLWVLLGLALATLGVTGVCIWWRKFRPVPRG